MSASARRSSAVCSSASALGEPPDDPLLLFSVLSRAAAAGHPQGHEAGPARRCARADRARHLPTHFRDKATWRVVAKDLRAVALGTEPQVALALLRMALSMEGDRCGQARARPWPARLRGVPRWSKKLQAGSAVLHRQRC
jgi:hypothetical protein